MLTGQHAMMAGALLAGMSAATLFAAEQTRALKIDIYGRVLQPEPEVYAKVMELTGKLVSASRLQKFIVHGWGIEGGASFCIELPTWAPLQERQSIAAQYKDIPFDAEKTYFKIEEVTSCP